MKDEKIKEYILCAAILVPCVVKVTDKEEAKGVPVGMQCVAGRRHSDCCITYQNLTGDGTSRYLRREWQGFITNTNKYVTRVEAAKIAFAAGQIKEQSEILTSEDLYYP